MSGTRTGKDFHITKIRRVVYTGGKHHFPHCYSIGMGEGGGVLGRMTVAVSVAAVRAVPWEEGEQVTQALLGTQVQVLDKAGGWYQLQMPDGYRGWVSRSDLEGESPGENTYGVVNRARVRIIGTQGAAQVAYMGTRLPVTGDFGGMIRVGLPGGGQGWLYRSCLFLPGQQENTAAVPGVQATAMAKQFLETPYQWGGCTCMGVDCSGLVQVVLRALDMPLPRDAHAQYLCGIWVDSPQAGDLIFFATGAEQYLPTHVGFHLGSGLFLHASSRYGKVVVSPLEDPFYRRCQLGSVRVLG